MTGPNPDAELDEALGVDQLPSAVITDAHLASARALVDEWKSPTVHTYKKPGAEGFLIGLIAAAVADEGQRAVARYIAEHEVAGTLPPGTLDGRLLAAREDYGELTRAAELHLTRCDAARADLTATGLPFAVGEARRRLAAQ